MLALDLFRRTRALRALIYPFAALNRAFSNLHITIPGRLRMAMTSKGQPSRVVDAYEEWFSGYAADPAKELSRTFKDVQGYDDIVMLRDIDVESHCEHHMAAFLGKAYVAYVPKDNVVGISKIARVVEIFAKRLQTQETMTIQIAQALEESLAPYGVAILIDAEHQCMTTRGVHHRHVSTVTTQFTGAFKTDRAMQERFLNLSQRK